MRFLPGYSLFDTTWDDFFNTSNDQTIDFMRTDVQENDGNYLLDMELPGYDKDNIQLSLKDGYLSIAATKQNVTEQKDAKGRVVRKERYTGNCQRSFYVGKNVREEDIQAKFENGELKVIVPKVNQIKADEKKYIPIQ